MRKNKKEKKGLLIKHIIASMKRLSESKGETHYIYRDNPETKIYTGAVSTIDSFADCSHKHYNVFGQEIV